MCEITKCQDLLGLGPPNALAPWIWALQAQSQVGLDAKFGPLGLTHLGECGLCKLLVGETW